MSCYSVLIAVLYDNFHFTRISIPVSVPAIMGSILSLLLAFRSNQAYDRWWEARILWGAIVNDSRSIARMVSTFIKESEYDEEVEIFKKTFIRRQIAWAYCLGQSLRKEQWLQGTEFLSKSEAEYLVKYNNKSSGILNLHSTDLVYALNKGWINSFQQVAMEEVVINLCNSMGGCERIKNTIFPVTYSLYTHLCLILFISILPFGLIEYFGIMEIPVVIAISSSLSLIEKMSIHLQDPFENKPTDTPVTNIAGVIERDLKQMLLKRPRREEERSREVLLPEKEFYVL